MRRPVRSVILVGATCLVPALASWAQQPAAPAQPARPPAPATTKAEAASPSTDPVERIKEEGLKHSQVMATLSYLSDVIGPRLTGSPNMKRANEWTRDRLAAWGLVNAHLEAWGPFGRGWSLKRFSAQVTEPQCIPVIAYPKAWSPGTEGAVAARVVYFDPKSEADFARFKGQVKGAIVLLSPPRAIPAHFEALGARKTDSELLELADAGEPQARGFNRRMAPAPAPAAPGTPRAAQNALAAAPPRGRFQMSPEQIAQFQLAPGSSSSSPTRAPR